MTDVQRNVSHGVTGYARGCRCDECKLATRLNRQEYYRKNRERLLAKAKAWREANIEQHREAVARWRREHPEWEREWAKKNPERIKAKSAKYYQSAKGQEYHRQWSANNADKLKAAGDKWRKANPDKVRQRTSTQRFKRRGAEALRVTPGDWRRLCERHRHCCFYCGAVAPLSQDHIIPLARGGRHAIGNIVPACLPCNSSKNKLFIMEWRRKRAAA